MDLDYSIFVEYGPKVLEGFRLTIFIVICAIFMGLPMGVLLAIGRMSPKLYLRAPAITVLEIVRNTPFMVQVFLLYYVLPFYGVRLPAMFVGIVALALFSSVYYAEIIRAGIAAVPRGQAESARAIGMSYTQSLRNVVFPQMWPIVLPPIANQTLSSVKESSILSTITVSEMTMMALVVQGITFRPFEVFIMITILYWLLNETIAFGVRHLEKHLLKRRGRQPATGTQTAVADASLEAARRMTR
jgi:His/Glu/Gln/Arg/opine family amino acid ABC transporter permease subunit